MTDDREPSKRLDFPHNWDVIHEGPGGASGSGEPTPPLDPPAVPSLLSLLAASWGDAVAALAVCTAALVGLAVSDLRVGVAALPWSAALGVVWWLAAAAAAVALRQGTPGMLAAGVVFAERVPSRRLPAVLGAALVQALLLGLPGLLGVRRSPLAIAAGTTIRFSDA
jgi:hypothetical protein